MVMTDKAASNESLLKDVTVIEHPLVARHMAVLRERTTTSEVFRRTLGDVAMLLLYEALRNLRVQEQSVKTPLEKTKGVRLVDEIVVIAILRAGLGMVESALRLVPEARVGHLGIYRDEDALEPIHYYENLPAPVVDGDVVIVDPMLATGGSAIHAIDRLKRENVKRIRFVCILAAPEGLKALRTAHPDVPVTCASIDDRLDERGFIRPGLGDAGDRLFGTD